MKGKNLTKLKTHLPTILSFLGAGGVIATAVLTAKATKASMILLEEAKNKEELTKTDKFLLVIPNYIPPIAMGTATIFCIFGANMLNKRQQASLISAYEMLREYHKEYKSKLKELYGEEAHEKIVEAITVEKCENTCITAGNSFAICSLDVDDNKSKPTIFYDRFSDRYFETTLEKVLQAEYHLNRNFVLRGYASLNEFYEFLGLEKNDLGDYIGWAIDFDYYWIDFNHFASTLENGTKCFTIDIIFEPAADYLNGWC